MTDHILNNLNPQQLEAVKTTEGYVRVIAGAGSGKTKALTHRYAYLVAHAGISPSSIMCITFTNKAAAEMKKRIRGLIGDLDLAYISTFHGFGVRFLQEESHLVHYPKNFTVLDEADTETIIKNAIKEFGFTSKDVTIQIAKEIIHDLKKGLSYIDYLIDLEMKELLEDRANQTTVLGKIIFEYLYTQRKMFGLDFDDLINFTIYLLQKDEPTRQKWQKRLEYVMVDEFQDVNIKQYDLVKILSEYHKNLFIVGDPDQTIYSWRGASVTHILDFDKIFPSTKTILMNQNYRSFRKIINAANSLIDKNEYRIKKDLTPVKPDLGNTVYFHAKTPIEEGEWIAKQILSLSEQGVNLSDISILYRAHFVSRSIEEALLKHRILYRIYSGVPFYSRKEIKDVLSYLRLISSGDDLSFERVINVPSRGIGKTRMKFLKDYAETHNCTLMEALESNLEYSLFIKNEAGTFVSMIKKFRETYREYNLSDLLTMVLEESGYEEYLRVGGDLDRLDNLSELKHSIYDFEITAGEDFELEDYLNHIALFTNMDTAEKPNAVKLMTIHSAKGLEFPFVFVCGMNEGIFPSRRTTTLGMLEEERRLAFVAYTRAKHGLFLTESEGFTFDNIVRHPSRFIFNTEECNLDYVVELPDELIMEAKRRIKMHEMIIDSRNRLDLNTEIEHPIFGDGFILDIDEENASYIVLFEELDTERTISFEARDQLIVKNLHESD